MINAILIAYVTCYYPLTWQPVGDHWELLPNPDKTVYEMPKCSKDDKIVEEKHV